MTDPLPRSRRTAAFERRVARALDALSGSEESARPLVVACSGGPDSSAALVAVARAGAALDRPVVAACFNHRLRPPTETAADAAFVGRLAASLGIECRTGTARPPRDRSEAAAREARYRWLARVAKDVGAAEVVTGHTLEDQAETVLLRLARGTGLRGLSAMAPRSDWPVQRGARLVVLRPLLDVSRAEVEGYLTALGIEARHDPSNQDPGYARNRVRHHVLPELRHINPRAVEAIARAAATADRDDQALEAWARVEAERLVQVHRDEVVVERAELRALPPALALRVLRDAAARLGVPVDAAHLEAMLRGASRRGARVALPGATFEVEQRKLALRKS